MDASDQPGRLSRRAWLLGSVGACLAPLARGGWAAAAPAPRAEPGLRPAPAFRQIYLQK